MNAKLLGAVLNNLNLNDQKYGQYSYYYRYGYYYGDSASHQRAGKAVHRPRRTCLWETWPLEARAYGSTS